jgi:hypothetical protein
MGDQPDARQLPTQTQTNIHALSEIRTHDPSVRAEKAFHDLDRAATAIGPHVYKPEKSATSSLMLL